MPNKKVIKDTPLAEITLRKYEKPYDLSKRDLIKRILLSLGLLQPGDSRDVIVDVFHAIYKANGLSARQIEDEVYKIRENSNFPMLGITPSNIRRQIRRLKEMFLIEKFDNKYRVTEKLSLLEIFEEKIEKYYIDSIVSRVKDYLKALK